MADSPYDINDTQPPGDEANGSVESLAAQTPAKHRMSPYKAQMLRANIVMGVLLAAGAVTVYALRWHKGPQAASAQQQQVDSQVECAILRYATDGGTGSAPATGKGTKDVIQSFYDQVAEKQVPLKDLRKNPFRFVKPIQVAAASRPSDAGLQAAIPPKPLVDESEVAAQAALRKLHLQSVMMGGNGGTAIISNNLLTIGQKIECFTVVSITQEAVVLKCQDKEYVLKMQ